MLSRLLTSAYVVGFMSLVPMLTAAQKVASYDFTDAKPAGVPPERVAVLMGHSSLTITLRHYARWVRERQEQLEADVRLVHEKYARYSLEGRDGVQQLQRVQ